MRRILNIVLILITLISLHLSHRGYAQVEQPSRFEIEVEWQDEYFNIISAEENGLFLIRKNAEKIQKSDLTWEITVLDTTLAVKWRKDIYLNLSYDLLGYDYYKNKVFLLFAMPESYWIFL